MTDKNQRKTLSGSMIKWLLLIVVLAMVFSLGILWIRETQIAKEQMSRLMELNIRDVKDDITDISDENLLKLTRKAAKTINDNLPGYSQSLTELAIELDVAEINIVGPSGIITASNNDELTGYDMNSGEQSAEFSVLLDGSEKEYVQSCRPMSADPSEMRKYAGVCLDNGGFVQVGYDISQFQDDIKEDVTGLTRNRHIGESGRIIIADERQVMVSYTKDYEGGMLKLTGLDLDTEKTDTGEMFLSKMYDEPYYCMYDLAEGYYIIAVMPQKEVFLQRRISLWLSVVLLALIFIALFVALFLLIRILIIRKLKKINDSLEKITGGDMNETVDVCTNREFISLSDGINDTVDTLKTYIAEANSRIDEELALARNIQTSTLPSIFPPYPEREEFSLHACMDTAREVGGDFYDYYLIENNKLVFTVADVSGKGIPAAMFMMSGKTMIRNYAERGDTPSEIFERVNNALCRENDAEMFITAWMGSLDIKTGSVRFVNAGHVPPVIIRDGKASFITMKTNLMLAFIEDFPYTGESLRLRKGDILFLYTDGVIETVNKEEELYGSERLLSVLSRDFKTGNDACREVCRTVREDLKKFAGEADQIDDITMLCISYCKDQEEEEQSGGTLNVEAADTNLYQVIDFANRVLGLDSMDLKTKNHIELALEEVFLNISHYAYAPGSGDVRIEVWKDEGEGMACMDFYDSGIPFDPLSKEDPDVTLSGEERKIGGLGIFLTKKSMDDVSYERRDGQNILHMRKSLQ